MITLEKVQAQINVPSHACMGAFERQGDNRSYHSCTRVCVWGGGGGPDELRHPYKSHSCQTGDIMIIPRDVTRRATREQCALPKSLYDRITFN